MGHSLHIPVKCASLGLKQVQRGGEHGNRCSIVGGHPSRDAKLPTDNELEEQETHFLSAQDQRGAPLEKMNTYKKVIPRTPEPSSCSQCQDAGLLENSGESGATFLKRIKCLESHKMEDGE